MSRRNDHGDCTATILINKFEDFRARAENVKTYEMPCVAWLRPKAQALVAKVQERARDFGESATSASQPARATTQLYEQTACECFPRSTKKTFHISFSFPTLISFGIY